MDECFLFCFDFADSAQLFAYKPPFSIARVCDLAL